MGFLKMFKVDEIISVTLNGENLLVLVKVGGVSYLRATIYQVIHTLQQKQLDWVPILLQKFQLLLLAVILLYSPVGLTPLKNIH